MRAISYSILAALALSAALAGRAAAEEFKYYVWIDDQGIVHASEEAPKGRDYKVRIIEDINANVVPAEDFRLDNPPASATGGTNTGEPASNGGEAAGQAGETARQDTATEQ